MRTSVFSPEKVHFSATASVTVTVQASDPFTGASNPTVNTATLDATNAEPVTDAANVGVTVTAGSCTDNTFYFRNTKTFDASGYDATSSPVPSDPGVILGPENFNNNAGDYTANPLFVFFSEAMTSDSNISNAIGFQAQINCTQHCLMKVDVAIQDSGGTVGVPFATYESPSFINKNKNLQDILITHTGPTSIATGERLVWEVYIKSNGNSAGTVEITVDGDPTVGVDDDSNGLACIGPAPSPILTLEKTVNASTIDVEVPAGTNRTLTYTIDYANIGGSTASGVTISDVLPAGTSYSTATPAGTPVSGQEYSWDIGDLASGASGSVSITVNVDDDLTGKSSLVNNASINATGVPSATATATTTVDTRQPDVRIFKSADKTLLTVGDTVTYTLTAVNSGTREATSVIVTDDFPDEAWFTYESCSTVSGSCTESPSGTLSWNIGTLAAGNTVTASFTMTVQTGAPAGVTEKDNLADATYDGGGSGTANSNTVTVAITTNPNLALSKIVDKANSVPGDTLTYTLTLVNSGSGEATGVLVTDPIPSYTSYVPGTLTVNTVSKTDAAGDDSAAFDPVGNRVRFNLGNVAGGATVIMTFQVVVNSTMPNGTTDVPNTATASASNHGSRQSTANTTVTAAPVLTIQKSGPTSLAYPSATLTADASSTTTLFVSSTATFEVGQYIKVGSTTARILSMSSKSLTVNAFITASSGANVIGSATYSLIYQNTGNADASNVMVTDTLPAGLGYFSSSPATGSNPGADNSGDVVWNIIGTLTAGASGTVQVIVFPTSTGSVTNTAKIDSNETAEVSSPLNINIGGLSVTKSTSTAVRSVTAPDNVASYTITVSNSTSAPIAGVSVTDQLPPGFTYKAGSTGGTAGAGEPIGSTIPVWTVTVPANSSVTITFQADIAAGASPGTYDNEVGLTKTGVGIIPFDPTTTTVENVTVLGADTAVLQGTIYHDQNASDGDYNSADTPLAGVLVSVIASNDLYYTAYTNEDGFYQLVLPAGETTVSVSSPDGYVLTTGTDKNNNATLTLVSGATEIHNVGYVTATDTGSISGTVWSDDDANGTFDPSEFGYPAVPVKLYASGAIIGANDPLDVIFSGPDGTYSFTGLADDNYQVFIVPPTGTVLTNAPNLKDATVSGGGDFPDVDFGLGDNLLPVANPDTNSATEGGPAVTKAATAGLIKDNDIEGDGPATITAADQGGTAITLGTEFSTPAGGKLTLKADGSYSYTPPAQGTVPAGGLTETFNYTITDANGDRNSSTLKITVGDNLLPVANPDTNSATEGGPAVTKAATAGLIKDNDIEGDGPA
ncbi:MAG: DUF11 domain-containing protein, partial [Candidatus Electrothrix sp. AW3_4]|nr:DUF11 domain-containing protein [Candidatus Electrothrix gigas]